MPPVLILLLSKGNRGLYDGVNVDGGFSTAELALQLDLPVLLVVNCSKTTRTVAAMVLGCREWTPRTSGRGNSQPDCHTRHESIVRQAVEKYTGVPVVGIVPRMKDGHLPHASSRRNSASGIRILQIQR